MRVILDTNVLLSALLRPGSVPDQLVEAWLAGRYVLVTHETQIAEFRDTSRRAHLRTRIDRGDAGTLVNHLRKRAEVVPRLPQVTRSSDPKDDYLLALCQVGKADVLVTGDKAGLLALGSHAGTAIVTARTLLDRLTA